MIDTKELARKRRLMMFRLRKDARENRLECIEEMISRKPAEITEAEEQLGDVTEPIIWITSIDNPRSGNTGGRVTLAHLENACEGILMSEAMYGQPNFRLATAQEVTDEKARQQARLDERIAGARHVSRGSDNKYGKLAA